jgi:hypothetical protein
MSRGMKSVVAICKSKDAKCALMQEIVELAAMLSDVLDNGKEIEFEPGLPAKKVADGLRDIADTVEDVDGDRWSVKVRIIRPRAKKRGSGTRRVVESQSDPAD